MKVFSVTKTIVIIVFVVLVYSAGLKYDSIREFVIPSLKATDGFIQVTNDFKDAKIPSGEIEKRCDKQDCVLSLVNPKFSSSQEASEWIGPDDTVFGVNHNGVQKAYPQKIMSRYEIVNDDFSGEKVVVAFCPLCNVAVSYVSKIDGQTADFGVSGFSYDSESLLYDRLEGNLWQQSTGEAVVGPAAKRNDSLEWVAATTTFWEWWVNKYPDTLVLSEDQ